MNRMKLAELTSGVGALVLGIGIGSLFPEYAFGMWDKHRLESSMVTANPPWVVAVYWICWALLAALVAVLVLVRR
jgi:hypothetical protein